MKNHSIGKVAQDGSNCFENLVLEFEEKLKTVKIIETVYDEAGFSLEKEVRRLQNMARKKYPDIVNFEIPNTELQNLITSYNPSYPLQPVTVYTLISFFANVLRARCVSISTDENYLATVINPEIEKLLKKGSVSSMDGFKLK